MRYRQHRAQLLPAVEPIGLFRMTEDVGPTRKFSSDKGWGLPVGQSGLPIDPVQLRQQPCGLQPDLPANAPVA